MSYYDDERSRRHRSTRDRRRDDYDDGYEREAKSTTLVRRRDDSLSSVEEVTRDFPPGERGAVYRETTVRKQGHRPVPDRTRSYDDFYDDRYDDRSSHKGRKRDSDTYVSRRHSKYDDRDDRRSRRYDSYSDDSSRSRTPPRKDRRKSTTEKALEAVGLGGVAGALLGKSKDRSRSGSRDRRDRSRHRGRSSSSSRSRGGKDVKRGKSRGKEQVTEALKAALLAGVGEAVRARKEPGGWGGEKGKRVLTAAISAGGVDGILSHNRDGKEHSTRDVIGSAIAGMATNRIVNGPRSKSRGGREESPDGRGRSQSRGIGDLAAGGVLAATGKKIWDGVRSRSRGRQPSRSPSSGSYDSRSPPRQEKKRSRSQSVGAGLARGLSAVGLGSVAAKVDPDRRNNNGNTKSGPPPAYDDYYDDRSSRNGGYRDSRDRDVGTLSPSDSGPPGQAGALVPGAGRSQSVGRAHPYSLDYGPHHLGDPETDSDSDLGDSSGDEKALKHGRKKGMISAGLATVATVHAAHNVYQSMEKREARRKALKEGDITAAQATREKNKARLQDAASVGIAALGIKGAYSEWKEMRGQQQELKESRETAERHKEKRDARRKKAEMLEAQQYKNSGYSGSMPNLSSDTRLYDPRHPHHGTDSPFSQTSAPTHYYDDNPYGAVYAPQPIPGQQQPYPPQQAFPPPPVGPPRSDTR